MPLAEHISKETSDGDFKRFMMAVVAGIRDDDDSVDRQAAVIQAKKLHHAAESKWISDKQFYLEIMAQSSFDQLRLIFEEYKKLSGHPIEQAIQHVTDDNLKEAMLAIGL